MTTIKMLAAIGGLLVLSWGALFAGVWVTWTVAESLLGPR